MSLWSYITDTEDPDESQARYTAMLSHYRNSLDSRVAAGTMTPADESRLLAQYPPVQPNSDDAAALGFQEGLDSSSSGIAAIPGKIIQFFSDFASKELGGIVKALPWWLWVMAAAAIFFWLGGGPWLARKTKGVLNKS